MVGTDTLVTEVSRIVMKVQTESAIRSVSGVMTAVA